MKKRRKLNSFLLILTPFSVFAQSLTINPITDLANYKKNEVYQPTLIYYAYKENNFKLQTQNNKQIINEEDPDSSITFHYGFDKNKWPLFSEIKAGQEKPLNYPVRAIEHYFISAGSEFQHNNIWNSRIGIAYNKKEIDSYSYSTDSKQIFIGIGNTFKLPENVQLDVGVAYIYGNSFDSKRYLDYDPGKSNYYFGTKFTKRF